MEKPGELALTQSEDNSHPSVQTSEREPKSCSSLLSFQFTCTQLRGRPCTDSRSLALAIGLGGVLAVGDDDVGRCLRLAGGPVLEDREGSVRVARLGVEGLSVRCLSKVLETMRERELTVPE